MNSTFELLEAVFSGAVVAFFLLNTGRGVKAIELCKECLILLKNEAAGTERIGIFRKVCFKHLYFIMFQAYYLVSDYRSAIPYGRKRFVLYRESGDRVEESLLYIHMGRLYEHEMKLVQAKKLYYKALSIMIETGDRKGETTACSNLGIVYQYLAEYVKSREYHEKALAITKETGDRQGEAWCYGNLGLVFDCVGKYDKAIEYYEKALAIRKETGDRQGEATDYGNLGAVFATRWELPRAKEYHEKALSIAKEINDRKGEGSSYGNLGAVSQGLAEYIKAKEYHEKALTIRKEIGDREGESADYGNLGRVFLSLGEHEKAKEYYEIALAIRKQIGDRHGEAAVNGGLGSLFMDTGEYVKAKEFLENALAITKEIGDRRGEGLNNGHLGTLFQSLGDFVKAKEYHQRALAIRVEIGDRQGEASENGSLGVVFLKTGEHVKAQEYLKRSLEIIQEIGDVEGEIKCLCNLAWTKYLEQKIQEAFSYLSLSVKKCEDLRRRLGDNDQFKASFFENHGSPYWLLSSLFFVTGNPVDALHVVEQGRARALADLMIEQYSVENEITVNPQSWVGIERVVKKERNCTCLYISHFHVIFLWILKANGAMHFKLIDVREYIVGDRLMRKFQDFVAEGFRMFDILPEKHCEDRSLKIICSRGKSSQKDSLEAGQKAEKDKENQGSELSLLLLFYKMIIVPVADFLDEQEIIIVPDTSYYKVPFAALADETGKYFSETFRIRIIPSLMTLKLIQESPTDYHSQTGALVVGDPEVGRVHYKDCIQNISPLPCARREAEMIGRILNVQPLLGKHATKQAVLQSMNSVSLIHVAAHGNAERGEIALAPLRPTDEIPQEEDYLLTMSDVSQIRLRAKLVVLSCCHSACGKISDEGVVGIARAFLGSGARSVLVAQWALEDKATEQLMSRFYEHLVRRESASESLHQAMRWMRGNGFSDVSQWAPFVLIGDNVTFDFVNKGELNLLNVN